MKNARPQTGTSAAHTAEISTLSPRLHRLAIALLRAQNGVTVRELMAVIPTNNPSQYVTELRRRYQLCIPMEPISSVTVDGERSWFGLYHLTPSDRETLRELTDGAN